MKATPANVSLVEVATFCAVYETGGVNAAARRLGLARSVISKRLTDLETALGKPLFVRSTVHLTPTEVALRFYARTAPLLSGFDDAVNDARDAGSGLIGSLRLSVPINATTAFLAEPILRFALAHPDLRVQVDLDDRVVDLATEGYDLAIRIGRLRDSALRARRLATSPRVLCASPDYLQAQGAPATLDEIPGHRTIGYGIAPVSQTWQFGAPDAATEQRSIQIVPQFVSNNGEVMRTAALMGLGLTVLPAFLVHADLASGRLQRLLAETPPTPDGIFAVFPQERQGSPKVRAMIEHLQAECQGRLPWAE